MRSRRIEGLLVVSWLAVAWGCGPVEDVEADPRGEVDTAEQELGSVNGLSFNGLSFNGLSFNGLSFNGLSFNGLSQQGLSSARFGTWFQSNPALANMVMRYMVRCAVPAGQTRSYTDARSGKSYSWAGQLGLAPGWASGQRPSTAEQQVVSACLAAHTTNTGVSMAISVLGRDGRGQPIPYSREELSNHSVREACFFGNLFNGEGVYVASDQGVLRGSQSSPRGCALSPGPFQRIEENCPPLIPLVSCDLYCEPSIGKPYRDACRYNGVTYRAITTRLRPEDVFLCGDGTCQYTESCGWGRTYRDCLADCGVCQ
ncbi:hypothetical protein HPC49_30525 [Pyxidicoccus fallax]|uniref:Uncharacterized protein n=1 Tax=Pyxidicoccus fallax TaxID=394095 RepID=A0A848LF90_9BACT|nr:hypothetical protein [Pyxidicoccus fallax]NMO15555.1 hypothetical protein [Pyxidicoccus fallax]NPC82545.1 hypothetical protein [Pyxidicoccus fallax]